MPIVTGLDVADGIRMLVRMRTTLVLDDALVRRAKARAIERGSTLSDVVNDALREALRGDVAEAPLFTLVTYGKPGASVRHEPGDLARALEDQERGPA